MAIQNFLSGGYYGKLGATVGQRWKNKRTIRTYVVPANPRTPTQQANRGKFADAVTFAQMGMQMNYYCTLFEDPNFTKWNYRMKVARELKNAGLSELDLIPLYPVQFNPHILITEFKMVRVTGQKHITFAVPALSLNTDRVLSIMFALYNEQDSFLGYKLYLGYYYASNPGYVEVDVDDITEINSHCFVRIISNDDEDSATDLIGSPRLAVRSGSIDIHTFDKRILNVQKDTTGITITFAEPWKGVPSTNVINFDLVCVIDGRSVTLNGTGYTLFERNGYCAVTFEHASSSNQMLPAFPAGSGISNLTVNYEGSSWQIVIEDANESYSDSDLTRSIVSIPTWDASSTGDITFKLAFGGTVEASEEVFNMVCSGRLTDDSTIPQDFQVASDGEFLSFVCVGEFKRYPMMNENDCIKIPNLNVTSRGVVYNIAAQTIKLRNAIRASYYFENLSWSFSRDGGGDTGYNLEYLQMDSYIEDSSHDDVSITDENVFSYVEITEGQLNCVPTEATREYLQDASDMVMSFRDNYSESENNDKTKETSNVIVSSAPSIVIDGVTYTFSHNWMSQNVPKTLSDWD